jgi:TonB-dependent Receptor Plug Domain
MKKLFLIIIVAIFSIAAFSQQRLARVKTKEELLNEEYCSALFNTQQADYFDLLDDKANTSAIAYLNILDWLQGRVAGLQIYTTKNNLHIPFIRNQRTAVYVNEIRMDYDYLNMLPVADIAMIKVIKGPFAGGWGGAGGAIAIYTIRGDGDSGESMEN